MKVLIKSVGLLTTSWLISLPSLAMAQVTATDGASGASGNAASIADIIVTAQKRSESINNVPLAISAFNAEELAARGVSDTEQLAKVVPSFNIKKSVMGQPVFYIRGVGFDDPAASVNPTVSVYTDEAALPYSTMARGVALDIERIEVLKGPQGTLFGQNSTGGAVNYIAAKPTKDLAAGFDFETGRFDAVRASAFVSGPISDTLGFRIAVQNNYQDDWQKSVSRDDSRGAQRFYNGRISLDWQPSGGVRFQLTASGWRDKSHTQAPQATLFAPANPVAPRPAPFAALSNLPPPPDNSRLADWDPGSRKAKDDSFYQLTLRGDIDLSLGTLTSITSYADAKVDAPSEFDGTAFNDSFVFQTAQLETFSQELRLAGQWGKGSRWLLGINYQYADTREAIYQTFNATNTYVGPFEYDSVVVTNNQRVDTYAGFAGLDFELSETLTARASGRYTVERRDFNGCLADGGNGQFATAFSFLGTLLANRPIVIPPGGCATFNDTTLAPELVRRSLDEENFSWRVGLDWKPSSGTLLYANIAKGYKSGGFSSLPAVFARQSTPVTQESLLAYEAGLKASLLDRRVQLNVAAFYYDYKNKQLQGYVDIPPFGAIGTLVNLPKARVLGAEFELTARPTEYMDIKIGGTYLDTEATSVPTVPIGPLGGTFDFTGESFPQASKYQLIADIAQRFPLTSDLEGYVGASTQYRSDASATFGFSQNALTRSVFKIEGYALVDLRAGVNYGENLTFEIWGRNVTNKFYLLGVTRTVDTVLRYPGQPVTYGARVRWRF